MKKLLRKFILCIILLFSLTSCSLIRDTAFDSGSREVKVYFTKLKGPKEVVFIPVERKISKDDSLLLGALRELFLGPTKAEELKGIMTEIPVGTRLIKVEESEDEILVDLSSQYLIGGGSATVQVRYLQLYKTLKKIAPQKKLYLHVDGKSLKTISGEGLEVTQPLSKINDYTKVTEEENVQP